MKAIQINTEIKTSMGINIAPGAVVLIAEGYAAPGKMAEDKMPAQVANNTYASAADYLAGAQPVPNITDYPAIMQGFLSKTDYETQPTEMLLITMVYNVLETIYPGKIEIVTI